MLRTSALERIQAILSLVPRLVDALEQRIPTDAQVLAWMRDLENALQHKRPSASAKIAALRGGLISAERGVWPSGLETSGARTASKLRLGATVDVIRRAVDVARESIRDDEARIGEAEVLCQQIVSLARSKRMVSSVFGSGEDADAWMAIWCRLSDDPELQPGAVKLEALVGLDDALTLLRRTSLSAASAWRRVNGVRSQGEAKG